MKTISRMEGWKPEIMEKCPVFFLAFDNRRNSENVYANNLMEKILARDNMNQAYRQVVRNKGKHGIDGMTVDELLPYLKEHGNQLRKEYWTAPLQLDTFRRKIRLVI